MDVIPFKEWRVWAFMERGSSVIINWLDSVGADYSDRIALQSLIAICELSGPEALRYCREDLGNGFYAIISKRKGGLHLAVVYCHGPFSDTEITLLAGALIEKKGMKPRYVVGIAEENLESLRNGSGRRCYGNVA